MTLMADKLLNDPDMFVKNTATRTLTFFISKNGFLGMTVPELLDGFVKQLQISVNCENKRESGDGVHATDATGDTKDVLNESGKSPDFIQNQLRIALIEAIGTL
jgi:hypothetical protein